MGISEKNKNAIERLIGEDFTPDPVSLLESTRNLGYSIEEAISDFAPAYQDQVQKRFTEQWLSRIAVNYPVTKHIDKLDEILKKK